MIFKGIQKTKLLKKGVLIVLFFLITFFPSFNSNAAYFKYSEFNWDVFAEENKEYWTQHCVNDTNGNEDKCVEAVLNRQKKYYTRLYALLAKYQKKGLVIKDNTIIATSFFDLDPDTFSDDAEYYKSVMGSDYNPYNVDDTDMANYDINQDDDKPDIFEAEADTLKLLLKSMVGYSYVCYGSYGKPDKEVQNGVEVSVCNNGGTLIGGKCQVKINGGYMGFWDYMINKNQNIFKFFGIESEKGKECTDLEANYPDGVNFALGNKAEVSEDKYWEFLEKGDFFDRKGHLQHRYEKILTLTNHKKMDELTNDEKEEYAEEILEVRRGIIEEIKEILENYGDGNTMSLYTNASSDAYWWPVGGAEVTPDGQGKTYAIGDPVSTVVTSPFGMRYHPINGTYTKHNGVDIGSGGDVTNIIASKSGVVTTVVTGCNDGDSSCGGGFGNYVVLSHADGNKTLYAHLAPNSIIVSEGENVGQGQILAHMGTTGLSTGVHLHFEVHVNDEPVEPLDYISAENPRPASMAGTDLHTMLVCMEGKGPDDGGSNYIVYDDKCGASGQAQNQSCGGTLTVGAGITLKWQAPRFSAHGIDVNDYYYPGAKIPKSIVDSIKEQLLADDYDSVNALLSSNGITLATHQIDALVSRKYNCGNINEFPSNYLRYGDTQSLYDNFMNKPVTSDGEYLKGLENRRNYEWNLFHNGVYYTC